MGRDLVQLPKASFRVNIHLEYTFYDDNVQASTQRGVQLI